LAHHPLHDAAQVGPLPGRPRAPQGSPFSRTLPHPDVYVSVFPVFVRTARAHTHTWGLPNTGVSRKNRRAELPEVGSGEVGLRGGYKWDGIGQQEDAKIYGSWCGARAVGVSVLHICEREERGGEESTMSDTQPPTNLPSRIPSRSRSLVALWSRCSKAAPLPSTRRRGW
jgi:hypothetical protein